MVYGLMVFLFLSESFWRIGTSLREEQVQGTLESFLTTPSKHEAGLVAKAIAGSIWAFLGCILALVGVIIAVGDVMIYNVPLALFVLAFTLLNIYGMGLCLAGLGVRLKETVNLLVNALQFIFMIFC